MARSINSVLPPRSIPMTETPVWHFPEVGHLGDNRLPTVLRHLRRSGVHPATKPSTMFPHHLAIFVAQRAKGFATRLLTRRYSRI